MPPRRAFLRTAAGLAAAPLLEPLFRIDEAFATELDVLSGSGRLGPGPQLREQYLLDPDVIYFNHGSMGTMPRAVADARRRYVETCERNPWRYMWSGEWDPPRELVRAKASRYLGCDADEMAITHNTTEGFNVLAHGLPLGPGDEVVFSSLNHPGASVCWFHVAERRGFRVRQFNFPVLETADLTADDILAAYERHLTPATRVLVFPHIDNIVGLRYPVRDLTRLARQRGVEFVAVDGAQAVGMIPVDVHELGVDFYATSPHKWLQAPKGLGLLYVREDVQESLRPMWVTWGQERWEGTARIYEDYGTRNLPELLALGHAIDFQTEIGDLARDERLRAIRQQFRERVARTDVVTWRSADSWSLGTSVFALEVAGWKSGDLFDRMNQDRGFVFRPFSTQGLNIIRISPNVYTTDDEIDRFFEMVGELT